MISLNPFLYGQARGKQKDATGFVKALGCYSALLLAFGKSAAQDGTPHGIDLEQSLVRLERRATTKADGDVVVKVNKQALAQLERWGESVSEDSKAKAEEIKQLLIAVGRTAESIGSRDQAYKEKFNDLILGLEEVENLNDLTRIKSSLTWHVKELKACVDQMASDNQQLVSRLNAQVTAYQHKLQSVEDIAFKDEVTGIANRRCVERQVMWNIRHNEPFCVVVLDLNEFKATNDRYGHLVGDKLLQQFAIELRNHTRAEDLVGRWGGDEFVVVLMCNAKQAVTYIDHIRQWVNGKYVLKLEQGGEVQISIHAAVGMAEWKDGMNSTQIIEAADKKMYAEKRNVRQKG